MFTHSGWSIIWIFLFIYSIAVATFSFTMSVVFSKSNTATIVAALLYFITYQPFSILKDKYDHMSFFTKTITNLPFNSGMSYGIQMIHVLQLEARNEGLTWSNLMHPVGAGDDFTVFYTMVLMLVASIVHLIIALYVEQIWPGQSGVPQPWNFPFKREFWFGAQEYPDNELDVDSSHNASNGDSRAGTDDGNFEADPVNHRAGIEAIELRKVYDKKKAAVNGLTLKMFDDQITALLGHNGAGKSSTMSMLTGMIQPTSGTAFIDGCDLRTTTAMARVSIGLCPQQNILFDELTVREHIQFYSRLKGFNVEDAKMEVEKYVRSLELKPKIDAQSSTLSGGMKRKLSLAVALCDGSKVVLCDEPTSGMDPAARRALWELLQAKKKGRTILLSTHFMDEADVLGDRIAIMADGELKCCGTSFFLKNRFGTGYHLICVKGDKCKVEEVTRLLRNHLPEIRIESEIGQELSYGLPSENRSRFEQMFRGLGDKKHELGLDSVGVSLTTLEEVFLKVGSDSTPIKTNAEQSHGTLNGDETENDSRDFFSKDVCLVHGIKLILDQINAMFKKRLAYTKRLWLMFVIQVLIPVVLVVLTILLGKSITALHLLSSPSLEIDLSTYKKSVTILEKGEQQTGMSPL